MIGILLRVVVGLLSVSSVLVLLWGVGFYVLQVFPGVFDRIHFVDRFLVGFFTAVIAAGAFFALYNVGVCVLRAVTG